MDARQAEPPSYGVEFVYEAIKPPKVMISGPAGAARSELVVEHDPALITKC